MCSCQTYQPLGTLGAIFDPAYEIVRKHEGGYVNNPLDPGGETYAGISRRSWAFWPGWDIIDRIKESEPSSDLSILAPGNVFSNIGRSFSNFFGLNGLGIPTNTHFEELEPLVYEFYINLWSRSKAGQILDQQVANNYFDFFVLSSRAVEILQRSLNKIGFSVTEDNVIGSQTLRAVNQADPEILNSALVTERKDWHDEMVISGRAPGEFLNNWKSRAASFGSGLMNNSALIIGGFTLAALAYYGYRKLNQKKA